MRRDGMEWKRGTLFNIRKALAEMGYGKAHGKDEINVTSRKAKEWVWGSKDAYHCA